jgi:hypothetical protein
MIYGQTTYINRTKENISFREKDRKRMIYISDILAGNVF